MTTKHERTSPFPLQTTQGLLIDETCLCGAQRSEHQDTDTTYGHGACSKTRCPKFCWTAHVYGVSVPRMKVSEDKAVSVKALEEIVGEPLTDDGWNALVQLTRVELMCLGNWLATAKSRLQERT